MIIWPEYISMKDWSARLIEDYPDEYLPILENEDDWQKWAIQVAGTGVFQEQDIPTPFSTEEDTTKIPFNSWQEWAKKVYNIMIDS